MTTGTGLVCDTVERIVAGDIDPIEQEHIDETTLRPAPKIFKEDCRIDWTAEGRRIVDFVRGLSPYPAAWSPLRRDGAEAGSAKIFRVRFRAEAHAGTTPGTIRSDGRDTVAVACADGWIEIDEMQLAGKRRMSVRDLLLGFREIESYRFDDGRTL